MNNELRKKYWNKDYVEYWKERVDSTNKMADDEIQKSSNDPTAPDSRYIQLINLLNTQPKDSVLDVGCGFGRSLPYLASIAKEVIGIDISSQMIDESRKLTAHLPNVELKVSESESMKINRESIDKIICFAAFDAMYQKIALIEFNRICKLDGEVLITGKNDFFKELTQIYRVMHSHEAESGSYELNINEGDIVVVTDMDEEPCDDVGGHWWRGYKRESRGRALGRKGYVPSSYLELCSDREIIGPIIENFKKRTTTGMPARPPPIAPTEPEPEPE